jgi:phosphoadenosine phosphosulfate reductase
MPNQPKTLQAKIDLARRRMEAVLEEFGPRRATVAWTGGKDSTMALHLWRGLLAERGLGAPRALHLDTGCKFPEVLAFRDRVAREWDVDLQVAAPDVDADAYPLARDPESCCRDLKIAPLARAVAEHSIDCLVTGLRRDEHPSRAERPWREERDTLGCVMAHAILECTEMDVWAHVMQQGLPWCGLYGEGYRSLGCRPCTELPDSGERSGRAGSKERAMERLHALGYF